MFVKKLAYDAHNMEIEMKHIKNYLFFTTSAIANESPRPNVLMIVVDDLNDWFAFLGGPPDTKTPNIDKLATREYASIILMLKHPFVYLLERISCQFYSVVLQVHMGKQPNLKNNS